MRAIVKHTLVSCIINAIFSIAFFVAFFSGESTLVLGQMSKLTIDFLPQALFVGFFSTLPPSILILRELKAGRVNRRTVEVLFLPANLPLRVVVLSLSSLIVFGCSAVIVLNFIEPFPLAYWTALMMKAGYGVLVSLLVTPVAVMAATRREVSVSGI